MEINAHVNMETKRAAMDVASYLFSESCAAAAIVNLIDQSGPCIVNGFLYLALIGSHRDWAQGALKNAPKQAKE